MSSLYNPSPNAFNGTGLSIFGLPSAFVSIPASPARNVRIPARSTRISELLPQGNHRPKFRDDAEEEELLKDRKMKTQRLDALEKQIDVLLQERAHLKRDLDDYKVIFDPIRRIPVEILQRIFIASLFESEYYADAIVSNSFSSVQAPWNVSQVSLRWREVALAHAALWAYVGITLTKGDVRDLKKCMGLMSLLSLQISRAESLSLTVHISIPRDSPLPMYHSLPSLLIGSAPRWRLLSLDAHPANYDAFLALKSFFRTLSALHVRFEASEIASLGLGHSALTLFDYARQLKTAWISSAGAYQLRLPWEELEELRIVRILRPSGSLTTARGHTEMLRSGQGLKRLHLPSFAYDIPFTVHITHRHIRELILTHNPSGSTNAPFQLGAMLEFLTLSSLESLEIHSMVPQIQDIVDPVLSLVKRSDCKLKKFSLRDDHTSVDTSRLVLLFENFSELKVLTLQLRQYFFDPAPIIVGMTDSELLPSLKYIRFAQGYPITLGQKVSLLKKARPSLKIDVLKEAPKSLWLSSPLIR